VRLFLDANILFSAVHSPEGGARELFKLSAASHCDLVSSQHAIFEAQRNLLVKSPSRAADFERILRMVLRVSDAGPRLVAKARGLGLPQNDAPILGAAVAAEADMLVTGDRKHFGHLYGTVVGRVRIVTLVEALETVVES
jgi:predicted nucleic acid-binding protein